MSAKLRIMVAVAAAIVFAAGSASAQQRGRGGFGFGGGNAANLVTLAGTEAVQKDLGLSGDSASKLTALRDDYRAASQKEYQAADINFQGFQNLSNEERQKVQQKMAAVNTKLSDEFNPKVKALLSADQVKRLEQIQLQVNLRFQGPAALATGDLASQLNLTGEQKEKLMSLGQEYGAKQRELFSGGNVDQEAMAKLRQERTDKTMAVLTAEQKEKLKSLEGSSFDVSQVNLGFGGRGGRRGQN
jgi:ABC-type phosphate/phosphonate transport system substrate-binding protein